MDCRATSLKAMARAEWRQVFDEAWRLERDFFYEPNMHGLDWDAMHAKYLPLVDRVTTRAELSDLIGRFVGELSALHTSVRGGDLREGDDDITVASLGARASTSRARASAARRTSGYVQRGSTRTLMWMPREPEVLGQPTSPRASSASS